MIFSSLFSFFTFIIYIFIFIMLYFYMKKTVTKYGFNSFCMFILTFAVFYFVVPFVQTFFKLYRDDKSLFTRILNHMSDEVLFFNLLISLCLLFVVIVSYSLRLKHNKNKIFIKDILNKNGPGKLKLYKKLNVISDIIFLLGASSMILLVIDAGSLSNYLSLGAMTRGLGKSPTDYISSSSLQLVTLSVIILIPPYLYLYLYRFRKSKIVLIKFIVSLGFSLLFLLYNQGRAPLIIFLLPFLFTLKKKKNTGFLALSILSVVGLLVLNYLDALFNYIAYGKYSVGQQSNLITTFLSEFSYPFTNFTIRDQLVDFSGYRYMYDYFIWPFTMIPSSILEIFGISKEGIISVSNINTEAYGYFLGVNPSGGIPVDFLTVNYYQFGYITLILACIIVGRALRYLDVIFSFFSNNFAIKVVLYRISFSMINILNNADLSAIIRNRLDVVILLIIVIYIYKHSVKYSKQSLMNKNI